MQDDGGSDSDDEEYTQADQNRISELFPRDLTSLFAPSPQLVPPCVPHNQPLAVAGTQGRSDVSLERMQVVMRIRPSMQHGIPSWSKENCIHAVSGSTVAIAPPESSQGYKNGDRGQTYNFTRVFNEHTAQEEYFQATAAPLVRHLVQEQQAAAVLMAYGISAAGKTYTIEGTRSEPGVLPRALHLLFQEVRESPEQLTVHVSQFEVYNEQIYDLLAEEAGAVLGQRPALRLKEDSQGRIFVKGLSEVAVGSAGAAMDMQRKGARQRQKAATALNYHSSRSHSIFTVALYRASGHEEESARMGRLSFVDLAGSERANRTGNVGARLKYAPFPTVWMYVFRRSVLVRDNEQVRFDTKAGFCRESVAINASLMTLGRCLEALRWNQQHRAVEPKLVPYRESKVTHLFRDVLHGWGQILLSVNVSPCAKDYDETSHVLKYASLATQIGTAARAEAPIRALKAISPNITKKRVPRLETVPSNLGPLKKQRKDCPSAKQASDAAPLSEALSGDADLGEQEAYASSCSSDADEESEVVQELEEEVRRLHDQLVAAEERCALAETEIRQEVSSEMASLLHDMEANYKERLASEVAAVEKKKTGGAKVGRAVAPVHSSHSQTDGDVTQAQLHSMAQQLTARDAELEALRAELHSKTQALESAPAPYSGLTHSHDALLSQAQARETAHAEEKNSLSEQLQQSQQDLAVSQSQCKHLLKQLHDVDQQLSSQTQQIAAADYELQQAKMNSQAGQPQSQQGLRQSLERELRQQVTQLEDATQANSQMEVGMLQQQLEASNKEKTALKRRLEAATAALASANLNSANPTLLRVMQAGGKGGSQRGAGGTPHALALAWAREEAARLSPALTLASTSKTPHPGAAKMAGASPAPSLANLFPPSPHAVASTLPGKATAVKQKYRLPEQQQSLEPAVLGNAAALSASDAQESEAQRGTDALSATQAASRLSLLQAEQTQAELELASNAQTDGESQVQAEAAEPDKQQQACQQAPIDALLISDAERLSHHMLQQEIAVARAAEAELIGPSSARAEQADFGSAHLSEDQLRQPVAKASQSEPLRPKAVCDNGTTHASEDRAAGHTGALGMSCAEAPVEAVTESTDGAAASEQRLHMRLQAKTQIAEGVNGQTAESQQGQKRGGRAKRPPKPKQPVRKKQTRKRGRPAAQQDQNVDSNKAPHQQSGSLTTSVLVSVAKEPLVVSPSTHAAGSIPPASPNAAEPNMTAEPRAAERPKRRKLQPATPISRSVQETLTDFVADDSHFRQHMKQTPVALRTRRATRFGGL
ncbi:MAG: kinesin motor domain containing [Trebouxia sp. A1-2]|nr:MAG: kinesin motor domain containing [Trebouxia sp. A1-2]